MYKSSQTRLESERGIYTAAPLPFTSKENGKCRHLECGVGVGEWACRAWPESGGQLSQALPCQYPN